MNERKAKAVVAEMDFGSLDCVGKRARSLVDARLASGPGFHILQGRAAQVEYLRTGPGQD